MGIAKEQLSHISMEQISAAFYTLDSLSLSTQLDVYSPSPLNLPVSKCYAQLLSRTVTAETQLLHFLQRCTHSGCSSSWLSFITVVIQAHVISTSLITFSPHAARRLSRYICEKSQFNSLVWGECEPMLSPICVYRHTKLFHRLLHSGL